MRFSLTTSIVLVCALLVHVDAFAANYYVRATGSDSASGTAPSVAFATIKKAAEVATSGDTIYVGAGTYTDAVIADGIQQSSSLTQFIADTNGTFTGDAGSVVIAGTLGVVNSNYIAFRGFEFQGAATWPLVWKGSYEGLVQDCVFTAGNEPLLSKDGELTFDNCQLSNFVGDGIYVDGEALVTLSNCSISACQQQGLEISKTARVVLDGTTIEDNLGDGVKIEQTAGTINDGISGASGSGVGPRLAAGKYRILASGGMFDGYNSDLGPYGPTNNSEGADLYGNSLISASSAVPIDGDVFYAPGGSAVAPNCTGTISQISAAITMAAVDVGDAATNNNNGNIPLTDLGLNPLVSGSLVVPSGHTLILPAGTYYFTNLYVSGGTLQLSGETIVFVTSQVNASGGTIINPSQKPSDFKLAVLGTAVTLTGTAPFHGAIYAPSARITLSGTVHLYGMAVANEIVMSGGGIHIDSALTAYGAAVQGIASGASSPSPPPGWSAIPSGELIIRNSVLRTPNLTVRRGSLTPSKRLTEGLPFPLC